MAELDVNAMLEDMATKAPKKEKKSDTPEVTIEATEQTKTAVKKFLDSKKEEAQAKAKQKQQEELLLPLCEAARLKHCRGAKTFAPSVRVKLSDGSSVLLLVTQEKYSEIGVDQKKEVQAIFGDLYDKSFAAVTEISMTETGLAKGAELLPKIIGAIGVEAFKECFAVKQTLVPTGFLHESRTLDEKVCEVADKAITKKILKPTKSSLRVP